MVRLRSAAESTFGGLPRAFWWLWIATLVNRLGGFVLPFFAFYITGPLHRSAVFAGAVTALFGRDEDWESLQVPVSLDRSRIVVDWPRHSVGRSVRCRRTTTCPPTRASADPGTSGC